MILKIVSIIWPSLIALLNHLFILQITLFLSSSGRYNFMINVKMIYLLETFVKFLFIFSTHTDNFTCSLVKVDSSKFDSILRMLPTNKLQFQLKEATKKTSHKFCDGKHLSWDIHCLIQVST